MAKKSELIQLWLKIADEKIAAAKLLLDSGYYDDAASRAYYAIYHAAQAALLTVGVEVRSHAGLFNQFGLHFIKTGRLNRRYSRILATAFQARQASDYNAEVNTPLVEAQNVIADAEQFVAKIKELLSETP